MKLQQSSPMETTRLTDRHAKKIVSVEMMAGRPAMKTSRSLSRTPVRCVDCVVGSCLVMRWGRG